ncbi:hypothetical protein EZV61_09155 [Corallincola luteus]|uniref:Haem-binding uptake Tiki superfamily ChaN domain-containing protein n=1 Tax=Corallincola luteus TaxID=1775177 RepID=A0ABY2ALU5_9GAMM|nr:hypothetical protein [Corallincola luteus]TCI03701.1 hypothetical protein EZV61_09155 [Corallincola luteus]
MAQNLTSPSSNGVEDPIMWVKSKLLDKHIVGLGEAHWFEGVFDHLVQLALSPQLDESYSDLVVEFGNRKHQSLLNAYLSGSDVPDEDLAAIWLDSMAFPAWLPPQYGRLFYLVREANKYRKTPIKVHLAEPEFDWNAIRTPADLALLNGQRDQAIFNYLKLNFALKDRPAIIIIGARHLLKKPLSGVRLRSNRCLAELFQEAKAGKLVSVWPHMLGTSTLADHPLDDIDVPSLISADGELAQRVRFDDVLLHPPSVRVSLSPALFDMVDGYLYTGPQCRSNHVSRSATLSSRWRQKLTYRLPLLNRKQQEVVVSMLG